MELLEVVKEGELSALLLPVLTDEGEAHRLFATGGQAL